MRSTLDNLNIIEVILNKIWLVQNLVKRDISIRYKDSIFGMMWVVILPIIMLLIYTFVFSVVFKAKWGGAASDGGDRTEFALLLFSGLIIFNFFSEVLNRSPGIINSNVNYVKKVVFPLEVLPIAITSTAFINALISIAIWYIFYIFFYGFPSFNSFLSLSIIFPFYIALLGLSWLLSSIGVFLKDLSQLTPLIGTLFMFLSPIFFPLESLPEKYQWLMKFNPLYYFVTIFRDGVFYGKLFEPITYFSILLTSLIFSLIAYFIFQSLREGFSDAI